MKYNVRTHVTSIIGIKNKSDSTGTGKVMDMTLTVNSN